MHRSAWDLLDLRADLRKAPAIARSLSSLKGGKRGRVDSGIGIGEIMILRTRSPVQSKHVLGFPASSFQMSVETPVVLLNTFFEVSNSRDPKGSKALQRRKV